MSEKSHVVLFEQLENEFPNCIFSKRGRKIIIHDGSFHNGKPAICFTSENEEEYLSGILKSIYEKVESNNYQIKCKQDSSDVEFVPVN